MTAPHLRTLRNADQADDFIRERVPFRSRVRLYDRYGNFGPFVSLSGTVPCRQTSPLNTGTDCVEASAKQGESPTYTGVWGSAAEGTIEGFCHTEGNLPPEYHESLLASGFVVRSFATPIAWHINVPNWDDRADVEAWLDDTSPGMWIIPEVAYSPTTYNHQQQVRWALHGNWRNQHPALPTEFLRIEGAPTRVRSGGR